MKALKVITLCSVFAIGINATGPNSTDASTLAERLERLSKTGASIVDREYREDKQTVTVNENGEYVVHIDSLIGHQTNGEEPTVQHESDSFVVPSGI